MVVKSVAREKSAILSEISFKLNALRGDKDRSGLKFVREFRGDLYTFTIEKGDRIIK